MRILVITNLYPPYYVGGYEIECRNVVEELKARGHTLMVLTSTYGIPRPQQEGNVHRRLKAQFGWQSWHSHRHLELLKKELLNQKTFKRLCSTFKPDVIYAWHMGYISMSLVFMAQQMRIPVCYRISDNWLSHWEEDPWYSLWKHRPHRLITKLGKRLVFAFFRGLGLLSHFNNLDLSHVQFASHYNKQITLQANKPVAGAAVIPWGIDVKRYAYKDFCHEPKRLLYVGRIVPHKGVQTAIEAFKLVIEQREYSSLKFTIVGGTVFPDYEIYIRQLVKSLGIESNVSFTGMVAYERLPSIYQEHDILIFPSISDECFSSVLREAMACGLAIVSTNTGGNDECLEPEVNALIFSKGDAKACAVQIQRLLKDQELFDKIRQNGRRTMEEKFRFEDMMDKIENSLSEAISRYDL